MKFRIWCIALVIVVLFIPLRTVAGGAVTDRRVTVYYFYTNARCPSCLNMERWTGETLRSQFGDLLDNGALTWSPVNLNGEGNYHFVKDYRLYTKSVILSEKIGGREVRWKNLDRVWELLKNEGRFRNYVQTEVLDFLGDP